ncbi:aspartate aminotransferase family protein [Teichococcus oryzae]|uniref:Aminotransferase class III-fold pyridoxal phosphate-dependent enzyme n=1 Tax=Teichococcus oryzae TaxID=1608942 RepID=A0A5B2TFE6_9PROT|nr:aminotransferase class III-fold pyridoxal phosphate-dependent enzyme [Pseudoroseomonas oryzae]KAA2213222.1 aminotransferase class III-fold pyridoxal phosphate-dependent enzyme [Pseudoroseomonas oryzae]
MRQSLANTDAPAALEEAKALYAAAHPTSRRVHEAALGSMPGGNTRTGIFFDPFPVAWARGDGATLWDEDGHRRTDFLGEATAGIYGHRHPVIRAAIEAQLERGWNFGGHTAMEGELAGLLCARFPSLERVRLCNSGSEANTFAVQTARVVTGRPAVLGFAGCYHGGFLTFTAQDNPLNVPFETVVAPFNDIEATRALIDAHAGRLAVVIVEPMIGGGGCIPADRDFLLMLRERTAHHGIVLIFDEVMTSRLSPGGLQAKHGITPDMTTLGKYIGGGFTAGAFGGRADLMEGFDPRQSVPLQHSGTYNNNVFTLAAGIAGLGQVYTPEAALALNARGDALRERLNALCHRAGAALQVTGIGSMLAFHARRGEIRSPADAAQGNAVLRSLLFYDLLERGIYTMPKRGFMALSLPLTDNDFDALEAALQDFIEARRSLLA